MTLERESNSKQAPKTEDKKNEEYNVNFKADEGAGDNKRESIEIIDEGKIIRGNTAEDAGLSHAATSERKAAPTQ